MSFTRDDDDARNLFARSLWQDHLLREIPLQDMQNCVAAMRNPAIGADGLRGMLFDSEEAQYWVTLKRKGLLAQAQGQGIVAGAGGPIAAELPSHIPKFVMPSVVPSGVSDAAGSSSSSVLPPVAPPATKETDVSTAPPRQTFSFEPGKFTSEFKIVVGILAANAGVIAAVLTHFGINLSPGEQASVLAWITSESSLLGAAYAAVRSWRKKGAV